MLFDVNNSFSAVSNGAIVGDSPTSHSSATPSTNAIDLGTARDLGGAVTDELFLECGVIAAFAGSSSTMQVQLQGSNDNSSWTTIEQSDAVPVATLVQGYKFLPGRMVSPQSGAPFRYLRLNYVIGTADMSAGTLVAGLVPSLQKNPTYPRGYTA